MEKLGRKLFLFSLLFALIGTGLVYIYLESLKNEDAVVVEQTKIIVAAVDIPARTLITKDMIKEIEIPKETDFGNFIADSTVILNRYTKYPIYMDEKFLEEKLVGEDSEELSALIKGDHRAMTVMLTMETGVADLVNPGDFVDIIIFLPELKEQERIIRPNIAKLLLQNVEVLAIDQKLYRENISVETLPTSFYATLSVPIVDVERLALAENLGSLEVILRPIDKDYLYRTDGVVWEELLLDESGEMKDLFPQFDVAPTESETTNEEAETNAGETDENAYDKYIYYTIKSGDTLRSISRDFFNDESQYILIQNVNRIEDENTIVTGTGIKIPVLTEAGEADGQN